MVIDPIVKLCVFVLVFVGIAADYVFARLAEVDQGFFGECVVFATDNNQQVCKVGHCPNEFGFAAGFDHVDQDWRLGVDEPVKDLWEGWVPLEMGSLCGMVHFNSCGS